MSIKKKKKSKLFIRKEVFKLFGLLKLERTKA